MKKLLKLILILSIFQNAFSQNEISHSIFLLGNIKNVQENSALYQVLEEKISQAKGEKSVLFLGDFLDKDGLENQPTNLETAQIERLINLGNSGNQFFFLPGDAEWNNTKKGGWEKINNLDAYLKEKLNADLLLTDDGCPGPKEVELGENLVMIAINSHWFLHPENDRPAEEDVVCDHFNETGFWEEVEDIIKDNDGKNILIAAHHPVISYGHYAGFRLTEQHFLPPIIGSFRAAYHKNVGTRKDLSRSPIKRFQGKIVGLLRRYPSIVCVAGHEQDLQVNENEGSFYINSGSIGKGKAVSKGEFTQYKSNKRGFIELKYYENGRVEAEVHGISKEQKIYSLFSKKLMESGCLPPQKNELTNERYRPCKKVHDFHDLPQTFHFGRTAAGEQYLISKFGQFFLGELYRTSWAAELQNVPYLPLDTLFGGLVPYAKGGGGQTFNLKLRTKSDARFSFRSIDKNPTRRKNPELVSGIYGNIVRDLVSSQHPYAPLVLGTLMDAAKIPHSQPKLYLMPDSPLLGNYREEFSEMLGFLEVKPKKKTKVREGFQNADEVESTLSMVQDLLNNNKNSVDQIAYAKARLFDMWVADWDRHHDNWKWLGYKKKGKKGMIYKPFPKDRDKAFAKLEGLYSVLDWEFVGKEYAKMDEKYGGLKSLNNKAKNLDRLFANQLTGAVWDSLAMDLQKTMTDAIIEKSMEALPEDAREFSAGELVLMLKIRRDNLLKISRKYYKMLAERVAVIGSDEAEIFDVIRQNDGNILVKVFDKKKNGDRGRLFYERLFLNAETDEIQLYGLGEPDDFFVTGNVNESILVRIIPGKGQDLIEDNSSVASIKRMTKIYNNGEKDNLILGVESEDINTAEIVKLETEKLFDYNYHLFLPTFSYNEDDGFSLGLTGSYTRQKFNKPNYGSKYSVGLNYTTRKIYSLSFSAQFRHVIKKWDLRINGSATNRDRFFRHFYGLGNETKIDGELNAFDFYENQTVSFVSSIGLIRQFPHDNNKSSFSTDLVYETRNLEPNPDRGSPSSIYDGLTKKEGRGVVKLAGLRSNLNIDFRDSGNFPTKGTQLEIENFSFLNSAFDFEMGGRVSAESSIFLTTHQWKKPFTLSFRVGGIHSYGNVPFYYKAFIGQENNHRGFRRNRFGGESAAYTNSELRWHLGTIYTPVVPLYVGILGLYDIGRVWSEEDADSDVWHTAYGGGFYIIPFSDSFNLNFTVARSKEEKFLFNFKVGFFVR